MSDPRYQVALRIPAPPDAVLASIRQAIATRRSDLPAPLRKNVRGLAGKVRDDRFFVRFDHVWEAADDTELVGMVLPAEGGGSDVRASVVDERTAGTGTLVMFAIAGLIALLGEGDVAWMLAGLAAVGGIASAVRRVRGSINHDEATFLLEWLQGVLDPLASPHPHPAPIGADPAPFASAS